MPKPNQNNCFTTMPFSITWRNTIVIRQPHHIRLATHEEFGNICHTWKNKDMNKLNNQSPLGKRTSLQE